MKQMKRELYEKPRLQEVEFDFKTSIAAITQIHCIDVDGGGTVRTHTAIFNDLKPAKWGSWPNAE